MTDASHESEPGGIGRLLMGLRPTMASLFLRYGLSDEEAATVLREAVDVLIVQCRRIRHPRRFFLKVLEETCAAAAAAKEEEESHDGSPDA
jgi:hypothetical protein